MKLKHIKESHAKNIRLLGSDHGVHIGFGRVVCLCVCLFVCLFELYAPVNNFLAILAQLPGFNQN